MGKAFGSIPRGGVGLAHRRLSIIDLVTGQQPMPDGRGNWMTFNGEIYNFIELRPELGDENFRHHLRHGSHPQAYRNWGADCVQNLRGMFAFALWDEANQRLFCARDRFGIKPFYYTVVGEVLYLASEAKALIALSATDRNRSRRLQGLSDLPVLPGRQDVVQRRHRASARPHSDRGPWPGGDRAATGRFTFELDFHHTEHVFRGES